MRVIQRAATFAYAFVAMNRDQAAALLYLARGGEAGSQERAASLERCRSRGRRGVFMRGMLILVAVGGALALVGVPAPEPGWNTVLGASHVVAASIGGLSTPIVASGAGVSESASLLMLAGGFFTAAVLVRRRG
jgi:hypothetical protein